MTQTAGAALEGCLSTLMRWGSRTEVQRALRSLRSELSATDAWLLRRILDVGPVRLSELATWQRVDKSTMTTQVGRLERTGLVARATDPADRRAALVRVTPKGRRLHERDVARASEVLDGLVVDWSEADRSELIRLLGMLVVELDDRERDRESGQRGGGGSASVASS